MTKLEKLKQKFEHADLASARFNLNSIFLDLTLEDNICAVRNWALERGANEKKLNKAEYKWKVALTFGSCPDTVEDFVELFTRQHEISARFDGTLRSPKLARVDTGIDIGDLARDLRLTARRLFLPFNEKAIGDAIAHWLSVSKAERLNAKFTQIVGNGSINADREWAKLVHAFADTDMMSAEYVIAVIKASMWQVKRKLADDPSFPVLDHLMPVLQGPQRAGKSNLSRLILSPIADLTAASNFTEITDTRNLDLWKFPMIFLDEMEAADRSDIEAIKNAITRTTKSGRVLYTNSTAVVRVWSSFWGCMNGTLGDKIVDPTGLRRFGPIQIKYSPTPDNIAAGLPVMDWEVINTIDYLKLWQSVDYKDVHPVTGHPEIMSEWSKHIESERQQDSVEIWLRQFNTKSMSSPRERVWTTEELNQDPSFGYQKWSKDNGFSPVSLQKLGRRMSSLSALPWYPFEPPRKTYRGSVHCPKPKSDGLDAFLKG